MRDHDTSGKVETGPADSGPRRSIFPTFAVNVPMPRDTAVPGSYNKPAQQSSSAPVASKPPDIVK